MILDGKEVKKHVIEELNDELTGIDNLTLTVIQVGDDPASNIYIRNKEKMITGLNQRFDHVKLDESVSLEEVLRIIDEKNNDPNVTGLMVQMPVPDGLDSNRILEAIDPNKDVDGLTSLNAGKLVHNEDCLIACTPQGIMDILDYYNIPVEGKNAVVIGRSVLVGKPMQALLTNRNATVTLCHSKTQNLIDYTRNADILIVAVGKPKFITDEYVKEGAVVIDVGINKVDGVMCGDVDFESVQSKASYITPVPGGVGQTTVSSLGKNLVKAYRLQNDKK